jgi:hypothetical protein
MAKHEVENFSCRLLPDTAGWSRLVPFLDERSGGNRK